MSVENPVVFSDKDCTVVRASLTLLDLPVEILLHICSFLDASTIVHGLGSACKQFYDILSDDSLWKSRIGQIWPNARYPVLPPDEDDELFWKESCVAIEKHLAYSKDIASMDKVCLTEGHYSVVDALMLMDKGRLLVSGGRDRSLCCWYWGENGLRSETNPMSHEGWIWDLTSIDETLYSCSWDSTVKSWHLEYLHLEPVRKFEMNVAAALLCLTSYPGVEIFATGSYGRTVVLFDPRVYSPIASYRPHNRAVLKLAMNEKYVLSASEDRTVSVWDQRAGRIMKTMEISRDSYPISMIMDKKMVHVGDSNGNLHLLNPKKDFEIIKSYSSGHTQGINCLSSTPGGLITGSKDKSVRLLSPTDPPQLITSLQSPVGEIAGMDYLNGVLAVSGSHVQVWRPKTGLVIEDT